MKIEIEIKEEQKHRKKGKGKMKNDGKDLKKQGYERRRKEEVLRQREIAMIFHRR